MGIVKWTEYEDKFKECEGWLENTENKVQGYNKLYNSLVEKRMILEEFQLLLQKIFDWQKTLDLLNMRAQSLLETCADSRVSNAVTQLTTRYNTLLSLAKEVMRRLEMHYQEHHQHSQLYSECCDWIEQTRASLTEASVDVNALNELHDKLACVKTVKNSLDQGQHKLRYVLELKERVILNTDQDGANEIQETTDKVRQDFESLLSDIYKAQQAISTKMSRTEETEKMCSTVLEWLDELYTKATEQGVLFSELSDKKAALEKYKILSRDIDAHSDMVKRLNTKQSEESSPVDYISSCINKYEEVKDLVTSNIDILQEYVKKHERYQVAYSEACEWIHKICQTVQQSSSCHGERKKLVESQEFQVALAQRLPEGEKLVEKAIDCNKAIMNSTSSDGQDILCIDIETIRQEWVSLKEMNHSTIKNFNKCIEAWDSFFDIYDSLYKWIGEFPGKIINEPTSPSPEDLEHWMVRNMLICYIELSDSFTINNLNILLYSCIYYKFIRHFMHTSFCILFKVSFIYYESYPLN